MDVMGYVMVGTNDLDKATAFFDALLKELGHVRCWTEGDSFRTWGKEGTLGEFSVTKTANGEPATVGNGSMIAFMAPDTTAVDRVYAKALELGGSCEGPAGPRGEGGQFYAGYFRDLDGNKFNVFHMEMPG